MEGSEAEGSAPGAPPSPLSGGYLLIVLGEPYSALHKGQILRKIQNGFLSWDKEACHVDLEKELQLIASQAPDGEESKNGERLIQFASENLVTEVLIHPTLNTLTQCIRNLLSSFTRHRHIIHAGYTFTGNGSWIIQDGTFSLADLIDAFQETDVLRVLRAYENTVSVDIHCAPEGDWSTARMRRELFSKLCCVRVNPDDSLTPATNVDAFMNYISKYLQETSLEQLLEPSDVVGNIRFSHPTLYVFPGGQGDAALFGINGFNMLVDGGFSRKACFWDFTRHLDRLDAVLMTRLNNSNCNGMAAVLRRKRQAHVYPQIGHFFCNIQERRQPQSPEGEKERDSLLINLAEEGQEMVYNLRQLHLKSHFCSRDSTVEPINLYHKVGHGKLDMYVLSPAKDSRDLKEFLSKWHANDQSLFGSSMKKKGEFHFPLNNLVSVCSLLVWQPANPNETITRLLFPGSAPQHKIFEGLEKLKNLDFLKHPVCSAKTLSPSSSTLGLTIRSVSKSRPVPAVIDKLLPGEGLNKPVSKTISSVESVNKQNIAKSATIPVAAPITSDIKPKIPSAQKPAIQKQPRSEKPIDESILTKTEVDMDKDKNKLDKDKIYKDKIDKDKDKLDTDKDIGKEKESETETKETEGKMIPSKIEKPPRALIDSKTKTEQKIKTSKNKSETKQTSKNVERKPSKTPSIEKKGDSVKSSPTTPKKTIESKVQKTTTTRAPSKSRASPSATPAKSAKEENNRKVVESKRTSVASRTALSKPLKKEIQKTEKKVTKRPTASPSKAPLKSESPKKPVSKVSKTKTKKEPKKEKPETEKGVATDSSTVSTPSTADAEITATKLKETDKEKESILTGEVSDKETKADLNEQENIDEAEKLSDRLEDEGIEKDVELTDRGDISDDGIKVTLKDDLTAEKSLEAEETGEEKFTKETAEDYKDDDSLRIHIQEKDESERDEEDEILIIEKVEIEPYIEDSTQEQESIDSHEVEEIEDELQKHLRDETESEKKLKQDFDKSDQDSVKKEDETEKIMDSAGEGTSEVKADGEAKLATKIEQINLDLKVQPVSDLLSPENKEQIEGEVQEIISSATDFITKAKLDGKDTSEISAEGVISDDLRSSGDAKDHDIQLSDDKNVVQKYDQLKDDDINKSKDLADTKYGAEESQPDEKLSTTIESGATTAPTLPEDERIQLDEIKEGIEEKHVTEETKEKDVAGGTTKVEQPTSLPQIAVGSGKSFEGRIQVTRDIVKTPDEVADLPVHEEVDAELYESEELSGRDFHRSKDDLLGVIVSKKVLVETKEQKSSLEKDTEEKEDAQEKKFAQENEITETKKTEKEVVDTVDEPQINVTEITDTVPGEKVPFSDDKSEDKVLKQEESCFVKDQIETDTEKSKFYHESGLLEQPILTTVRAPEVAEYVMLTPDSTPDSPIPKDEVKLLDKEIAQSSKDEKDVDTKQLSDEEVVCDLLEEEKQISSQKILEQKTSAKEDTKEMKKELMEHISEDEVHEKQTKEISGTTEVVELAGKSSPTKIEDDTAPNLKEIEHQTDHKLGDELLKKEVKEGVGEVKLNVDKKLDEESKIDIEDASLDKKANIMLESDLEKEIKTEETILKETKEEVAGRKFEKSILKEETAEKISDCVSLEEVGKDDKNILRLSKDLEKEVEEGKPKEKLDSKMAEITDNILKGKEPEHIPKDENEPILKAVEVTSVVKDITVEKFGDAEEELKKKGILKESPCLDINNAEETTEPATVEEKLKHVIETEASKQVEKGMTESENEKDVIAETHEDIKSDTLVVDETKKKFEDEEEVEKTKEIFTEKDLVLGDKIKESETEMQVIIKDSSLGKEIEKEKIDQEEKVQPDELLKTSHEVEKEKIVDSSSDILEKIITHEDKTSVFIEEEKSVLKEKNEMEVIEKGETEPFEKEYIKINEKALEQEKVKEKELISKDEKLHQGFDKEVGQDKPGATNEELVKEQEKKSLVSEGKTDVEKKSEELKEKICFVEEGTGEEKYDSSDELIKKSELSSEEKDEVEKKLDREKPEVIKEAEKLEDFKQKTHIAKTLEGVKSDKEIEKNEKVPDQNIIQSKIKEVQSAKELENVDEESQGKGKVVTITEESVQFVKESEKPVSEVKYDDKLQTKSLEKELEKTEHELDLLEKIGEKLDAKDSEQAVECIISKEEISGEELYKEVIDIEKEACKNIKDASIKSLQEAPTIVASAVVKELHAEKDSICGEKHKLSDKEESKLKDEFGTRKPESDFSALTKDLSSEKFKTEEDDGVMKADLMLKDKDDEISTEDNVILDPLQKTKTLDDVLQNLKENEIKSEYEQKLKSEAEKLPDLSQSKSFTQQDFDDKEDKKLQGKPSEEVHSSKQDDKMKVSDDLDLAIHSGELKSHETDQKTFKKSLPSSPLEPVEKTITDKTEDISKTAVQDIKYSVEDTGFREQPITEKGKFSETIDSASVSPQKISSPLPLEKDQVSVVQLIATEEEICEVESVSNKSLSQTVSEKEAKVLDEKIQSEVIKQTTDKVLSVTPTSISPDPSGEEVTNISPKLCASPDSFLKEKDSKAGLSDSKSITPKSLSPIPGDSLLHDQEKQSISIIDSHTKEIMDSSKALSSSVSPEPDQKDTSILPDKILLTSSDVLQNDEQSKTDIPDSKKSLQKIDTSTKEIVDSSKASSSSVSPEPAKKDTSILPDKISSLSSDVLQKEKESITDIPHSKSSPQKVDTYSSKIDLSTEETMDSSKPLSSPASPEPAKKDTSVLPDKISSSSDILPKEEESKTDIPDSKSSPQKVISPIPLESDIVNESPVKSESEKEAGGKTCKDILEKPSEKETELDKKDLTTSLKEEDSKDKILDLKDGTAESLSSILTGESLLPIKDELSLLSKTEIKGVSLEIDSKLMEEKIDISGSPANGRRTDSFIDQDKLIVTQPVSAIVESSSHEPLKTEQEKPEIFGSTVTGKSISVTPPEKEMLFNEEDNLDRKVLQEKEVALCEGLKEKLVISQSLETDDAKKDITILEDQKSSGSDIVCKEQEKIHETEKFDKNVIHPESISSHPLDETKLSKDNKPSDLSSQKEKSDSFKIDSKVSSCIEKSEIPETAEILGELTLETVSAPSLILSPKSQSPTSEKKENLDEKSPSFLTEEKEKDKKASFSESTSPLPESQAEEHSIEKETKFTEEIVVTESDKVKGLDKLDTSVSGTKPDYTDSLEPSVTIAEVKLFDQKEGSKEEACTIERASVTDPASQSTKSVHPSSSDLPSEIQIEKKPVIEEPVSPKLSKEEKDMSDKTIIEKVRTEEVKDKELKDEEEKTSDVLKTSTETLDTIKPQSESEIAATKTDHCSVSKYISEKEGLITSDKKITSEESEATLQKAITNDDVVFSSAVKKDVEVPLKAEVIQSKPAATSKSSESSQIEEFSLSSSEFPKKGTDMDSTKSVAPEYLKTVSQLPFKQSDCSDSQIRVLTKSEDHPEQIPSDFSNVPISNEKNTIYPSVPDSKVSEKGPIHESYLLNDKGQIQTGPIVNGAISDVINSDISYSALESVDSSLVTEKYNVTIEKGLKTEITPVSSSVQQISEQVDEMSPKKLKDVGSAEKSGEIKKESIKTDFHVLPEELHSSDQTKSFGTLSKEEVQSSVQEHDKKVKTDFYPVSEKDEKSVLVKSSAITSESSEVKVVSNIMPGEETKDLQTVELLKTSIAEKTKSKQTEETTITDEESKICYLLSSESETEIPTVSSESTKNIPATSMQSCESVVSNLKETIESKHETDVCFSRESNQYSSNKVDKVTPERDSLILQSATSVEKEKIESKSDIQTTKSWEEKKQETNVKNLEDDQSSHFDGKYVDLSSSASKLVKDTEEIYSSSYDSSLPSVKIVENGKFSITDSKSETHTSKTASPLPSEKEVQKVVSQSETVSSKSSSPVPIDKDIISTQDSIVESRIEVDIATSAKNITKDTKTYSEASHVILSKSGEQKIEDSSSSSSSTTTTKTDEIAQEKTDSKGASLITQVSETVTESKDLKISKPITIKEESGTVHRMVVTASSEDGGSETELCASESIKFASQAEEEKSSKGSVDTTPLETKIVNGESTSYELKGHVLDKKEKSVLNGTYAEDDEDTSVTTTTTTTTVKTHKDGSITKITTVTHSDGDKTDYIEKTSKSGETVQHVEKTSDDKGTRESDISLVKGVVETASHAVKSLTGDVSGSDTPVLGVISELKKDAQEMTRSGTPGSDMSERELDIGGPSTPHSEISSGQVSRAATNIWGENSEGRPDSQHYDSDDDVPCSPLSVTSHMAISPPQFDFEVQQGENDLYLEDGKLKDNQKIPSSMTSSFYGSLPGDDNLEQESQLLGSEEGAMYSSMYIPHGYVTDESGKISESEQKMGQFEAIFSRASKEDVDFETARKEHYKTRGEDLTNLDTFTNGTKEGIQINGKQALNGTSSSAADKVTDEKLKGKSISIESQVSTSKSKDESTEGKKSSPQKSKEPSSSGQSSTDKSIDPIQSWGKPLGLPPPPPEKNRWFPTWDPIEEWGKPLGLPTPAPPLVKKDSAEDVEVDLTPTSNKTTPKKVAKKNIENNKSASYTAGGKEVNTKAKRPESPVKRSSNKENRKSSSYIYLDLSYVPHNGNSHYTNVEFFKRVRARYYVFSGTEPSRDVFNALLEAKQTWEDKDLEVTIIPTYDTDVLGYWVAENEELLAKYKIDLSPSASRCTINLQDHETSCSAYRLEF